MSFFNRGLLNGMTTRHFRPGFSTAKSHQLTSTIRITDVTNPVENFIQTTPNETNWRYVNLRVTKLWYLFEMMLRVTLGLLPLVVMRQHKHQFTRDDYLYDDPAKNGMGSNKFQERLD